MTALSLFADEMRAAREQRGWSQADLADKIVRRRRGGFCYELNGGFALLLQALGAHVTRLAARVSGSVESAICTHGGGPPRCWCRPPLPGLPLAFARAHDIDTAKSTLIGAGPAHATLARALGATYRST